MQCSRGRKWRYVGQVPHRETSVRLDTALLAAVLVAAPAEAQRVPSEQKAFHLSLWGTVIPVAAGATWWATQGAESDLGPALVIAGGLVVGPALRYPSAYGGRGLRGAGLRAGLTLLSVLPAAAVCGWSCNKGSDEYQLAGLIFATGTGLSLASAVYDISRVKQHIRRHSETRPGPGFSFAPMYAPGGRSFGVNVGVTF
jgi:hypothetical protein